MTLFIAQPSENQRDLTLDEHSFLGPRLVVELPTARLTVERRFKFVHHPSVFPIGAHAGGRG